MSSNQPTAFEVLERPDGPRLLIREVLEEQADHPVSASASERTVDAIRCRAAAENVPEPFSLFIGMPENAGLFVRPYTLSVVLIPPTHHGRFLVYATPRAGGIHIAAAPDAFAECRTQPQGWIRETQISSSSEKRSVPRIEQIRKFVIWKLPPPGDKVYR